MKKLIILLLLGILLISLVSSEEIDKLTYLNNDLKVEFAETFLGVDFLWKTTEWGTAELKSHKSVNEVLKVGAGNQVTMYYDFDFLELYENGLGDVEFINMKTGEPIERDWKFVYWFEEERVRDVCLEYEVIDRMVGL